MLHELGHVADYTALTDVERALIATSMGDTLPWRQNSDNSPHERFAEAYSVCARHWRQAATRSRWRSIALDGENFARVGAGYQYNPTRRQFRATCQTIALALLT